MPFPTQKQLYWFVGLLSIVNGLQAYFTELIYDEAYYWYFSTQLDWGYFDHPPMVAWMIALGTIFFKGAFGVRLVGVLMSAATYLLLWETISHPKKQLFIKHFILLVFSMTLLNAYGFFSLPDTPLLFFTALLLFLLKRFYEQNSWGLSVGIGLCMAALMYSKYHAVLVIFGVLFGHLSLLKNKKAWGAVIVSLMAFSPHIYWLYEHDFVSVSYHLFERPNRAYDFFDFGLGYWVNLMAIFGFSFPFIYAAFFKSKANTTLKQSMWGIITTVLIFFFISSFNRRIQTQWIVVICIPMAYLVFETLTENEKLRKRLWISGSINILIIGFLRLGLMYEPLLPISYEAHGNKAWTAALKEQVGNAPVIFEDSYRNAPMYAFYSGAKTHSLNSIRYRENQYTIDQSESDVEGKNIAYISKDSLGSDFAFLKAKDTYYYGTWIQNYQGINRLQIQLEEFKQETLLFSVHNPYEKSVPLNDLSFGVAFLNKYKQFKKLNRLQIIEATEQKNIVIKPGETVRLTAKFIDPPEFQSFEFFKLSIANKKLPFLLGGELEKLNEWNPF